MTRDTSDDRNARPAFRRSDEGGPVRRGVRLQGITRIDLNDTEILRAFVTEHGKILPARIAGLSAKQQRQVKRGVKRCRVMGLIP
jgi:small subunit ribosomal protein S18